jgi:peptidoglycan hydrolase-like protein with peptidoglycan-binding domain
VSSATHLTQQEKKMKRLLAAALACALSVCASVRAQNSNTNTNAGGDTNAAAKKRGPVFRSTKEQVKQAQEILRRRGFYAGDATGKLDPATREGLKKFQGAEGLKVTGTLNAATLQKMSVALNDRQKAWLAAHSTGGR